MSSATGSNAPGEDDSDLLAVISFYQSNQLRVYIASAGFAVLFFECLITFNKELCYIRDHKRTWAKAMFVLNRYLSLLEAFATLFSATLPVSFFVCICVFLGRTIELLQILLYAVWAVFSALRVYALSNNDKAIATLVGLLSSPPVITFIYIAFAADYEVIPVPIAPYPQICYLGYNVTPELFQDPRMGYLTTATISVGVFTHAPLILAEAFVIVVTFMRIWNVALIRNNSPIDQVPWLVLKEGVLYFLAMLLMNSTQIIANFLYDAKFSSACVIFNLLVPILVSRFYLNLHEVRKAEGEQKSQEKASNLERAKSLRKSKPLPPIPERDLDDIKVSYLNEVVQYNRRCWAGAPFAHA